MRPKFEILPSRPLKKSQAWMCFFLNQFATPGLGSLMGRHFVSGSGQLLFAIAGFCVALIGMFAKLKVYYGQMYGTTAPATGGTKELISGAILFGIAWLWSLITSIVIIKNAKDTMPIPPVIV